MIHCWATNSWCCLSGLGQVPPNMIVPCATGWFVNNAACNIFFADTSTNSTGHTGVCNCASWTIDYILPSAIGSPANNIIGYNIGTGSCVSIANAAYYAA
mgnify:FL=1